MTSIVRECPDHPDLIVFFGSLVVVMAIGLWASRREETSEDFFLAGRKHPLVSGTRDRESGPTRAGIESCNSAVYATHCSLNIPTFGRFTEHPLDDIMTDIWTVINYYSPVCWLQSSEKR